MRITTIDDLNKAFEHGPYAWPGGYPMFFAMADGEALSYSTALANRELLEMAVQGLGEREWQPVALEINWEDEDLYCAHSNDKIQSAYGGD